MLERITPLLWLLFSAGGTLVAFLFPLHILVTGFAIPLGWVEAPSYESILDLVRHPLTRVYLFLLITLPLIHGAHRLRYTLYDAFKLKHKTVLIASLCYGVAILGTVFASYVLLIAL